MYLTTLDESSLPYDFVHRSRSYMVSSEHAFSTSGLTVSKQDKCHRPDVVGPLHFLEWVTSNSLILGDFRLCPSATTATIFDDSQHKPLVNGAASDKGLDCDNSELPPNSTGEGMLSIDFDVTIASG